ncbi:MAG: VWA domain-containing protein [Candidatus Lokiarchaeia archaeon]
MVNIDLKNLFGTLPPAKFSSMFCSEMRRHDEVQNAVSSRQAIAITKLLLATCFRKGVIDLNPDDYVRAAVISTAPEDQEVAREVAMDILFPRLKIEVPLTLDSLGKKKKDGKKLLSELVTETTTSEEFNQDVLSKETLDGLADFLGEMAGEFEIGNESRDTGEDVVDELEFYFYAVSKWKNESQPYHALINFLEDPTEILFHQIQSLPELTEYLSQKLLSNINNIPSQGLTVIPFSNVTESILESSAKPIEKAIAQHALGMSRQFNESVDQMLSENPVDLSKVAKALSDSGTMSEDIFRDMVERAAMQSKISSDIYNVIKNSKLITENIKKKLFDLISDEPSLTRALEITRSLDNTLGEPITVEFLKRAIATPELEEKISYQTLPYIPFYSKEIENTITKSYEKERTRLKPANKTEEFKEIFNDISEISKQTKIPYYSRMLKIISDRAGNDWMMSINARQTFLNTGHQLVQQGINLDKRELMAHGLKIGCLESEIYELLYSDFEMFLKSIKKGDKDHHCYKNILKRLNLDAKQLKFATNTAFDNNNRDAISAIASEDLKMASDIAQSRNSTDLLLSALTAGPGEDLLKQWFISRDRIPSGMREKMKKVLKNIVISTAMDMARMKLGAAESGLMASTQTRPYREGDEFDLINIEETLENLISVGKELNQIIPEDFMMHELKKGRVALLVLLDISGSMRALERLSYCALLVTMLLSRLKEQEIAVAIFESNTHVIIEFQEEKPEIERVIDELLDIKARGGTVINRALSWAYDQFKKIDEEKLYFIVASDFELYYDVSELESFKGIQKLRPKTYLISPARAINTGELNYWTNALGGYTIKLESEKDIIDAVCRIISNR